MSIAFSTLTNLVIPEGVVVQISDASGNVLWKNGVSTTGIRLLSSDGYVLTDSDGIYLTVEEGE